jgi:ABC-type sulfate/molybdate transport systems ATPase subunit
VIRQYVQADDRSLVFSTHVPEAALSEAQNVICLQGGRVLHGGPVASTYAHPPSKEIMECLGPGNWLTPEEAELWLDETIVSERCFRPEQIEIEPSHLSHLVVRESTFLGSIGRVELRHVNAAQVRVFYHRPSGSHLQPGAPALMRLRR